MDRWRAKGSKTAGIVASGIFLLSMFTAEAGVGVCGFLAAHAFFMDDSDRKGRILSLTPYAFLFIIWQAVYISLGYGASGSGSYIFPLSEPLIFIKAVFNRIPVLMLGHYITFPLDIYNLVSPETKALMTTLGAVFMGILALLVIPIIIKKKITQFFLAGMFLSLIPGCAASPAERVLMLASFGGYGLLGLFFNRWFFEERPTASPMMTGFRNGFAYLLILIHFVLSPLVFIGGINKMKDISNQLTNKSYVNLTGTGPASRKKLLYINHPMPFHTFYTPSIRFLDGLDQLGFVGHWRREPQNLFSNE